MNPTAPVGAPAQAFCPNCRGGNPLGAAACTWCGRAMDGPPLPNRAPSPDLLDAYKNALLKPSAEGFASEVSEASWGKVWMGLGAVVLASLLSGTFSIILTLAAQKIGLPGLSSGIGTLLALSSMFGAGNGLAVDPASALVITAALSIGSLVSFFVGTLYLYWLCGRFGGEGRTGRFGDDFKVHAYLMTLVSVPTSVVGELFVLVPYVGSAASLAISLYAIFLQYSAIRASMQLPRSPAQLAMIVYVLSAVVIGGIVTFFVMLLFLSVVLSNVLSSLGPGLR